MSIAIRNRIKRLEQLADNFEPNFTILFSDKPEPQWHIDGEVGLLIRLLRTAAP